jgi:dTDP-4-amino-4,6-dideoxygalactose transaminase
MFENIWENQVLTNHGPYCQEFESCLSKFLSAKNLSVVNNGTTGLMLALKALSKGCEVITTPFTFAATASSIKWLGLKPVFVDIEPKFGNIDPNLVANAITSNTGAILASHNFGFPADIEKLTEISQKFQIPLIFDAAPAMGVSLNGKSITSFGDASILSFHATKVFTTIEGGAVISRSKDIKNEIDLLRNFGISDYEIKRTGINAKLNEIQSAIGLLNLKELDQNILRRKSLFYLYKENLDSLPKVRLLNPNKNTEYNFAYCIVAFDNEKNCLSVFEKLKEIGIFCRRYWNPVLTSSLPYLDDKSNFPISQKLSKISLALPMGSDSNKNIVSLISRTISSL